MSIQEEKILSAFLKLHKIESYFFERGIITYQDIITLGTNSFRAGSDIYMFTNFYLYGLITNTSHLNRELLRIESTLTKLDYKNRFKFSEGGSLDQIESDYISFHNSDIKFTFGNPNVFTNIYGGKIDYYILKNVKYAKG